MSTLTATPPGTTTAAGRKLDPRPTLSDTLRDTATMTWRALKMQRRTPEQFFDVTLAPIIFTLMFTYVFGGAMAGSPADYLPFAIPGILAQTTMQATGSIGTQLREDMEKGVFDRFRAMPIARIAPLAGPVIASITRYALAIGITVAMSLIMGYRPGGGPVGVAAAIVLNIFTAWCVSWIFTWLATLLKSAQGVQGISMLVMFPLTFLSNALVNPETMPSGLRAFVNANPISHVINATRDLMNDNVWSTELVWSVVGCLAVVVIFAPLAVRGYKRKL